MSSDDTAAAKGMSEAELIEWLDGKSTIEASIGRWGNAEALKQASLGLRELARLRAAAGNGERDADAFGRMPDDWRPSDGGFYVAHLKDHRWPWHVVQYGAGMTAIATDDGTEFVGPAFFLRHRLPDVPPSSPPAPQPAAERTMLSKARNIVADQLMKWGDGGDRPQSPPAWLTELSLCLSAAGDAPAPQPPATAGALAEIRDAVLNHRYELKEGTLDNDQTNAVLRLIDRFAPVLPPVPDAEKHEPLLGSPPPAPVTDSGRDGGDVSAAAADQGEAAKPLVAACEKEFCSDDTAAAKGMSEDELAKWCHDESEIAEMDGEHERVKIFRAIAARLRAAAGNGEREDGWKREADRLRLALRDKDDEVERLRPFVDLFHRLDKRFGCRHTENGAEDAEQLLRHVDELLAAAPPSSAPAPQPPATAGAIAEIRDAVLNHRYELEEGTLDNDQTNAVLGVIDRFAHVLPRGAAAGAGERPNPTAMLEDARQHVRASVRWREVAPLESDIAVWMVDFAFKYMQSAVLPPVPDNPDAEGR